MKCLAEILNIVKSNTKTEIFYGKDQWVSLSSRLSIINSLELTLQANLVEYNEDNNIAMIEIPYEPKEVLTTESLTEIYKLLKNEYDNNKENFNIELVYVIMGHYIQRQSLSEMTSKRNHKYIEPEKFIERFNNCKSDIIELFESGYCYYFAIILKEAFSRGTIVWAAPYGHICWMDEDGKVYDIVGLKDDPEIDLYVPIEYLSEIDLANFKHTSASSINKSDISDPLSLMSKYAKSLCSLCKFNF